MRANSPGAFVLSASFHAAVVLVVAFLTWWFNRAPEITPHVFELVDFSDQTIAPVGDSSAPQSNIKFTKPKAPPIRRPEPQQPKPEPVKPVAKETPKPTPKTTPPKTVTYEEFLKQQGKTLEKNANPPPRRTKVPKIDSKAITSELQAYARAGVKDGSMSAAQATALDAYIARLITELRFAHEKPDGLSDLLKAKVSFYVAADGTLSAVRIINSSGDPDFDRSVIAAFQKVRSIGAVPGGKGYTWQLTFRMLEE